jgi:hypothetical protein
MVRINLANNMRIKKRNFMKTRILLISGVIAIAIFSLVACGKKKTIDDSLNGMWVGTNSTETYVLKFDSEKLEISRTRNSGGLNNQREVESGIYKLDNDRADYNVSNHSCSSQIHDGSVSRTLHSNFTYKHVLPANNVGETLKIIFGPGREINLNKIATADENNTQHSLDTYTNGCYVELDDGKVIFKAGKYDKVTPELQAPIAVPEATPAPTPAPNADDTIFNSTMD